MPAVGDLWHSVIVLSGQWPTVSFHRAQHLSIGGFYVAKDIAFSETEIYLVVKSVFCTELLS